MSDTPAKHTVVLKQRGRWVERHVPCIASGEEMIRTHLGVNARQPLRILRDTRTERVYTIPRGDHASLKIQPAC